MSNVRSVTLLLLILLLLSLFWLYPAATQRASPDSPPGSLPVQEVRLSASINRLPMGDRMVVDAAPATQDSRSREAADLASNVGVRPPQGPDQVQAQVAALLDTPPEWTAALQHQDKEVRREALQQWAGQGAATPLDPLTHALVDPDESVRQGAGTGRAGVAGQGGGEIKARDKGER